MCCYSTFLWERCVEFSNSRFGRFPTGAQTAGPAAALTGLEARGARAAQVPQATWRRSGKLPDWADRASAAQASQPLRRQTRRAQVSGLPLNSTVGYGARNLGVIPQIRWVEALGGLAQAPYPQGITGAWPLALKLPLDDVSFFLGSAATANRARSGSCL